MVENIYFNDYTKCPFYLDTDYASLIAQVNKIHRYIAWESCPAQGLDEMTPNNNCIVNRPTHCSDVTWICTVVMEILQLASVTVFEISP